MLGSAATWGEAFQGVPYPPPHAVLVFVGDTEEEELRAAASAASCGYQRALVLGGGLQQLGLGAGSGGGGAGGAPPPPQPAADLRFINRDALAVLLGMAVDESGGGGVMHAPPTTLIDVRRSDERALYGAIKGSVHIPGGWHGGGWVGGVDGFYSRLDCNAGGAGAASSSRGVRAARGLPRSLSPPPPPPRRPV